MQCPRCEKASLVEIRMRIGDSEVTFRCCGRCEAKLWQGTDGDLPLTEVLQLVRTPGGLTST